MLRKAVKRKIDNFNQEACFTRQVMALRVTSLSLDFISGTYYLFYSPNRAVRKGLKAEGIVRIFFIHFL